MIKRDYEYKVRISENKDRYSRYYKQDIYRNAFEEFLETYEFKKIPIKDTDKYVLIDVGWENRIDLVSHHFYGNGDLWWVIALANDLENPLILPVDTRLRIPGLSSLWGYRGVML